MTLSELEPSGFQVLEALSAGASVVASDVPVHREAASCVAEAGMRLVASECSPLQLSDAIATVAEERVPAQTQAMIPRTAAVVETLLPLYRSLAGGPAGPSGNGVAHSALPAPSGAAEMTEAR